MSHGRTNTGCPSSSVETAAVPGGGIPMLQVTNLAYTYPQKRSVGPFSFSAREGDLIHVTGSSGCGKSTIARCITGLIPHLYHGEMSGEVLVSGMNTADQPLWKIAEKAGFVFQNPAMQMLGNTVEEEIILGLENLGLNQDEIKSRLDESLKQFGLDHMRQRRPHTLSGGEQQKLALAAITSRRPPLLVLDEPLSMLDVAAATELTEYLAGLSREGTTVVIFEHRADYLAEIPGIKTLELARPEQNKKIPTPPAGNGTRSRENPFTLEVRDLNVRLGSTSILNNVSFSIKSGTVTAVVGRNGTGKTTLVRALAGLQEHGGTALVNGEKPVLGMVNQNADLQLFNATVKSEILYRVQNPDLVWYRRILGLLGLERYESSPPLILSEGEKKRLALATVLMRNPEQGILLDEPSLGQDTMHKQMLINICRELAAQNRMVLFTTHDLHLAAEADQVILLSPNGIEAMGGTDELFRDQEAWNRAGLFVPRWISGAMKEGVPV
ncbi:MAG TPA: ATP-binding cassette domain-containing protein [Spirochaetota bacterium]|nr:ATP-binding cassette domain-containing protein [Spirochaetota bacterium]HPI89704.1 ATP-binding cassette domain-containing protein [Spirochaetota bacterium]